MSVESDLQYAEAYRQQEERDRQEAIFNRAVENRTVAECAREYVTALQAYEDDRYSLGWTERATRAHLARAALWGACGFVDDWPEEEVPASEQLPI